MPKIITLCGSTRFKDEINAANARLTMAGNLVISLGVFGHVDMPDHDWTTGGNETKQMLDDLHKRKIDLADEILVINVGGYIGESTRGEIEYAEATGKPVRFLELPHTCDRCSRWATHCFREGAGTGHSEHVCACTVHAETAELT